MGTTPGVKDATGVKLEGLYYHTFTVQGKFMSQGRIVGEHSDYTQSYILAEQYAWMDGKPMGIRYVPKAELKFYQFYRDRADMVQAYESASPALKT